MEAIVWLIILVVMVVVEIATMGLTTIWFAGGALAAFIAAALDAGVPIQIILFFVVSFILLFSTRPIAKKHFNGERIRTNAESLIGETGIVLEDIDNINGKGQVQVHGQEWTARAVTDDRKIAKDRLVTITAIRGVKLIVEEKQTNMSESSAE